MKKTERSAMEELSFKQLCSLFCCPPCKLITPNISDSSLFIFIVLFSTGPSRITSKMAFLPPKITYDLVEAKTEDVEGESSKEKAVKHEFAFLPEYIESGVGMDEKFMKDYFEAFYTKTKRGNKIACLHIKNPRKEVVKYTILFSHGNAADLGMLTGFYCRLVHHLNVNLFR